MKYEKLLNSLSLKDENDIEELGMILSNNCDMGSPDGAMISVKAFEALAKDIIVWHHKKNQANQDCLTKLKGAILKHYLDKGYKPKEEQVEGESVWWFRIYITSALGKQTELTVDLWTWFGDNDDLRTVYIGKEDNTGVLFSKAIAHFGGVAEKYNCGNCHKCLEGVIENGFPVVATRMILCPECGNKRCPKASDHTLPCTNSNEPNQEGSVH